MEESLKPRAILDKAKHIKYWRRCINLLPHHYTSNDSNRMYLGYLMISALDLLGALDEVCSPKDQSDYIDWIYHCQHPEGGFRAWPGTDFGDRANEQNAVWDPANVPATYLALVTLLILGDDMRRVRRKETLNWLRRMQRSDGSFGETHVAGKIEGGNDPRFGYCATGVRYILRSTNPSSLRIENETIEDIDVDALVGCIRRSEAFEGGIADVEFGEPHAGYTFCSVGALHNMGRLQTGMEYNNDPQTGPVDNQELIRWLCYRQTELWDPEVLPEIASDDNDENDESNKANGNVDSELLTEPLNPLTQTPPMISCAGMNGRTNKVADTCYAWWSAAPLALLGHPELYDQELLQAYLLEKTQHPILGGFGKLAGNMPDVYHSSLGLAALGLTGHEDVKAVHTGLCCSREAAARLPELWKKWGLIE